MSTPIISQSALREKRGDILFAEKDEALRNDVRELGAMVGELLLEQGGEALYKTVESARRYSIGRREGDAEASVKLDQLLKKMSANGARDVVRAFSMYFQVVNTAEQVHRIRRRRDYLKDQAQRQPRSIDATFFELREAGFNADAVEKLLATLAIEPVFTAHPTETTRRTVLRKQQNIVRRMVEAQNPALTPQEYRACLESIRSDITAMWQTDENAEDLTVYDELEHTLFFLTDVIYRVIPPFYEAVESSLIETFGVDGKKPAVPNLLRFGSWIGGDVSTNEEISARTIRDTFARQRTLILNLYFRDCQTLAEKLSQSSGRVEVDEALTERIEKYAKQFPGVHGSTPYRYRNMPYRVFMRLVCQRLQATYDNAAFPYETAAQLLEDLKIIATSLANRKGANAGLFSVKRVIRRVETFGFHFVALDIRHNAHDLQKVVGYCLGEDDWFEQTSEQRERTISHALETNESPKIEPDNDAKRLFSVFQSVSYCRRKYGDASVGALLIRHCFGVDDVIAALLVARWSDIHSPDGSIPLDIVPSFENATELERATGLIEELMQNDYYRQNLATRKAQQIIKLSISDATADGSVVSSRWKMQRAHTTLGALLDKEGIDYTFFHGRGSLSGRGGVADGIARGHLRATEHGEAVNERYGVRGIALRTMEKAFSAVTLATAGLGNNKARKSEWANIIESVAAEGDKAYAILATPDFHEYFKLATPIDVIKHMRVGVRSQNLDNIEHSRRNIPWTFAWAQSRFLLPSWYGFGSGIKSVLQSAGIDELREMLKSWPFFERLTYDIEIALAVADLGIATHYSQLAGPELHAQYFPAIQSEFDCSVAMMLELREQKVLLEQSNTLRRSIRLRNPYVDPMSMLQVELLHRWRADERSDENLLVALRASVNGISRGLQTTG